MGILLSVKTRGAAKKDKGWVMKNEALRLFLAITALILTAMLTNPAGVLSTPELEAQTVVAAPTQVALNEPAQAPQSPGPSIHKPINKSKTKRKTASVKTIHKSTRSFAFFFRR